MEHESPFGELALVSPDGQIVHELAWQTERPVPLLKNVLPFNMMAMAMGLHPRCGIEDTIIGQHGQRMSSVEQIQQCVRVAHELGREVANGKEARAIYRIGVQYDSIEETLKANGMAPNRVPGQLGVPQR